MILLLQVTITVKDVNDMSPEFLMPNETSVSENTAFNTVVTVIKAVDKDEGRNGYLEYSLLDSAGGMFTLGNVDGLLRVNGKLDRETKANYTIKVKAKDRGEPSRHTETELVVKILDENDNNPIFNPKQYYAFVPENASIGTTVLQVSYLLLLYIVYQERIQWLMLELCIRCLDCLSHCQNSLPGSLDCLSRCLGCLSMCSNCLLECLEISLKYLDYVSGNLDCLLRYLDTLSGYGYLDIILLRMSRWFVWFHKLSVS